MIKSRALHKYPVEFELATFPFACNILNLLKHSPQYPCHFVHPHHLDFLIITSSISKCNSLVLRKSRSWEN